MRAENEACTVVSVSEDEVVVINVWHMSQDRDNA